MNKFDVTITAKKLNEDIMGFVFESEKSLSEAQEFFSKYWAAFMDLIVMLIEDKEIWHKKKTMRALDVFVMMFEWIEPKNKNNYSTKFTVSIADEETKKDSNNIETLIEKLWCKSIKLESKEDLKEVLSMIEKLIK